MTELGMTSTGPLRKADDQGRFAWAEVGAKPPAALAPDAGLFPLARRRGYNRCPGVVAAEVITARHRHIALLVAGCYFMEMLDGTNVIVS